MHTRSLLVVVCCTTLAATALAGGGARITAKEAGDHRGQLVTVIGPVTEIQDREEGTVLRVGGSPGLPIVVPSSTRGRFKLDLMGLHRRRIEVTGFLTTRDRPLAMVLERPEHLVVVEAAEPRPSRDELAAHVRALETELARVQSALPSGGMSGVTYGPVSRPLVPLPRYPLQPDVLAYQGVPTRVEWSLTQRVLVYGDQRWIFDVNGQLVDVRRQ